MDVVLEVFDTYLFDRIYANVLPIHPSISSFDPISTLTAGLKLPDAFNSTWGAIASAATSEVVRSGWQFQPASQSFSVQPSEYAYMSRWDRDNIFRQSISLYLITA